MQSKGTVLHIGKVVVDLALGVTSLPATGGDVFASNRGLQPGGGFNVMAASRAVGASTLYGGTMGTGPLSEIALAGLARIGVEHIGTTLDTDLGICVAITDSSAERTFISTYGAETMDPPDAFDSLEPLPGDVVYISGYSFASAHNRASLARFAARMLENPEALEGVRFVVDVSPVIDQASRSELESLSRLAPIWSVNEREARLLAATFGLVEPHSDDAEHILCEQLTQHLGCVLVRAGARGSWYCEGPGSRAIHVPSIAVEAVDTNGAGDAHSGVLCGALARGTSLDEALRMASIAGALSATKFGPATCPTLEEIEAHL